VIYLKVLSRNLIYLERQKKTANRKPSIRHACTPAESVAGSTVSWLKNALAIGCSESVVGSETRCYDVDITSFAKRKPVRGSLRRKENVAGGGGDKGGQKSLGIAH
jgi:hypothetical protein